MYIYIFWLVGFLLLPEYSHFYISLECLVKFSFWNVSLNKNALDTAAEHVYIGIWSLLIQKEMASAAELSVCSYIASYCPQILLVQAGNLKHVNCLQRILLSKEVVGV